MPQRYNWINARDAPRGQNRGQRRDQRAERQHQRQEPQRKLDHGFRVTVGLGDTRQADQNVVFTRRGRQRLFSLRFSGNAIADLIRLGLNSI